MKPLAGGLLASPVIAFKYLFQFPDVAIIPGIEKVHEIEEIVKIYRGPHKMTAAEKTEMKELTRELGTRFCRRYDYYQPCQQGIPISIVMTFETLVKRLPPDWYLNGAMIAGGMAKAATCTQCGECESRCPFHLPIREMIAANYALFEDIKAKHQPAQA